LPRPIVPAFGAHLAVEPLEHALTSLVGGRRVMDRRTSKYDHSQSPCMGLFHFRPIRPGVIVRGNIFLTMSSAI
jgi:hypothetical protein